MIGQTQPAPQPAQPTNEPSATEVPVEQPAPREIGGRDGPEPTRYGDWEKNG
ncbi:DUF1674 domain-containing protein, partial [Aquamicrobium sp.]